jgi:2-haloacid dehalogenase
MPDPRAFVFDAYGTLFDVHSVMEAARAVTPDPQALSQLWRQKQLEYTWLRSLMGRYQDFWLVTGQALRFALRRLGITAAESQIEALMSAYLTLSPFPEVPNALRALRGRPLAILSNGSPRMLESAVRSSGLGAAFDHVLSVDAVGVYKPSPLVYDLAVRAFGLPASEILFVSSNAWDVAGAGAYGFMTCWCNRTNMPADELDVTPDYEVDRLDAILERIGV